MLPVRGCPGADASSEGEFSEVSGLICRCKLHRYLAGGLQPIPRRLSSARSERAGNNNYPVSERRDQRWARLWCPYPTSLNYFFGFSPLYLTPTSLHSYFPPPFFLCTTICSSLLHHSHLFSLQTPRSADSSQALLEHLSAAVPHLRSAAYALFVGHLTYARPSGAVHIRVCSAPGWFWFEQNDIPKQHPDSPPELVIALLTHSQCRPQLLQLASFRWSRILTLASLLPKRRTSSMCRA